MLTEPKKLSRYLGTFYSKLERIGLDLAKDESYLKVEKGIDFLRDRLSRGDSNPRAWRALVVMFLAGRRYGMMYYGAWIRDWIRDQDIESMPDSQKIDFAERMMKWANEPVGYRKSHMEPTPFGRQEITER